MTCRGRVPADRRFLNNLGGDDGMISWLGAWLKVRPMARVPEATRCASTDRQGAHRTTAHYGGRLCSANSAFNLGIYRQRYTPTMDREAVYLNISCELSQAKEKFAKSGERA